MCSVNDNKLSSKHAPESSLTDVSGLFGATTHRKQENPAQGDTEATTANNPVFQKFDTGKRRYDLIPYDALEEVLKCLEHGAVKYDDHNWSRGTVWSRYWSASMRHLTAWWMGESNDPESGLSHLAHAICATLFVLSYELRGIGEDDRTSGP